MNNQIKTTILLLILSQMLFWQLTAQESMDYFLPADVSYNAAIPSPEVYFNQPMGEWHLTHSQVIAYLQELARISDRAVIEEYARSHENRPLVHMIFSSSANQDKLDELKQQHRIFSDPGSNIPAEEAPLVITLGYGIHGNESSATNASVITAYYLAAAQGDKINQWLDKMIILVDPCLNPDGFTRHSTWANMHQNITNVTSSEARQYDEMWPGGRSNHYWFDLNRDYLLLVHPETRGRVAKFHEWRPNVLTDHHEMGPDNTFFFQPGIPTRNNPLTPETNYRLTYEIARYHARFLDAIGSHYYMEESFDDYYIGKGSSYPDINGSIGILFEQAGFRGRIRETTNGIRTLAFGIRNQFTVSLSTLEASMNLRDELLRFQKDFYAEVRTLAQDDAVKAYIFGDEYNQGTTNRFIDLLNQHQIKVYQNNREITAEGKSFKPGSSFAVPLNQQQYRLIKSIFEITNTFTDSTFYDVSAWTIPFAFDVPFAALTSLNALSLSEEPIQSLQPEGKVNGGISTLGYLFRWDEYNAAAALYQLQANNLITKVSTDKFTMHINGSDEHFSYGTILVPVTGQNLSENEIFHRVTDVSKTYGIDFFGLKSGLSKQGIHIGSGSFLSIQKPEVMMIIGDGTTSRDAGEIWHMFDQQFHIPVTLVDNRSFSGTGLDHCNTLIVPPGAYRYLSSSATARIKEWTLKGGKLITIKNASAWAAQNNLGNAAYKKSVSNDSEIPPNYANRNREQILNTIGGAIFNASIDITHPICYGYQRHEIPIFKTGSTVAESLKTEQAEPVKFSDSPYLSGYVSKKNIDRIKNAPVVTIQSAGSGKVITFHESMAFRGIWIGTNKLFMNSIFFGSIVR